MTDILVVNHGLHQVCGIHDLGVRLRDAIPDSITTGYVEANDAATLIETCQEQRPAVVLVNYRADLMPWMPSALAQMLPTTAAVAHNYEPHTLAWLHAQHRNVGFDLTLALEPQLFELDGVVWSGRPMPPPMRAVLPAGEVPYIGSFGFAFAHKRFDAVAREVFEQLYPPAVFRLHAPTAHFGGTPEHSDAVIASVRAALADPPNDGYELVLTTGHWPAREVVQALARCEVNCLFYEPGQPDAGLSSALDYLLAAGRPIMVSAASMFRHALPAAVVWPEHHLGEVLIAAEAHAEAVRARYDELSAGYAAGIRRLVEMA